MFVGAFVYSFMIGSLVSWLSSIDAQDKEFHKNMEALNKLKSIYKFSNKFYTKLKRALKNDIL